MYVEKIEPTPAKVKAAQLSARRVGGMAGADRGSPAGRATLLCHLGMESKHFGSISK